MKLLTKQQQESYENAKSCYIYKEKLQNKHAKDKFKDNFIEYKCLCCNKNYQKRFD